MPTLCMVSGLENPNLRAEFRNFNILLSKHACLQQRDLFSAD